MPAKKKHPSTRARRNKTPGAATLKPRQLAVVPDPVDYAEQTVAALKTIIDARNDDGRPDDARLSKRGSKASLVKALEADDVRADGPPPLPPRLNGWTDLTREWWADVWSSPMSSEWDQSDIHNLYICAALYDDIWVGETAKSRKDAAGEYRLQCARLGLDPYSRRRLEWQIESVEAAQDAGQQRRERRGQPGASRQGKAKRPDPRAQMV